MPKVALHVQYIQHMKNLIGVIVLAGVCVGLAVVLLTTKKQAAEEKRKDIETIEVLSNNNVKA